MVSRRDIYLLSWGGLYVLAASYIGNEFDGLAWVLAFAGAGAFSLMAALFHSMWKKATAFGLLTGVSALRGVSYVTPFFWDESFDPDVTMGAGILYLGITISHVLVSGWHSEDVIETSRHPKEDTQQGD